MVFLTVQHWNNKNNNIVLLERQEKMRCHHHQAIKRSQSFDNIISTQWIKTIDKTACHSLAWFIIKSIFKATEFEVTKSYLVGSNLLTWWWWWWWWRVWLYNMITAHQNNSCYTIWDQNNYFNAPLTVSFLKLFN